jgi:hypothetical protein
MVYKQSRILESQIGHSKFEMSDLQPQIQDRINLSNLIIHLSKSFASSLGNMGWKPMPRKADEIPPNAGESADQNSAADSFEFARSIQTIVFSLESPARNRQPDKDTD